MNKYALTRPSTAQSGFTLIELIVVIVILGILSATALPRFADMGTDARIAKMHAAVGAMKTGVATVHGSWLAKGSPAATTSNSTSAASMITLEGEKIAFTGEGYPDVGGVGANTTAGTAAASGIVVAAGGLADYVVVASSPTKLTISADANHMACAVTYTEPVGTAAPVIDTAGLSATNC